MEAIKQIEARKLAIKWVIVLERDKDPAKLETREIRGILDELEEENKNPEHWTQQECEEFLTEIIERHGTPYSIHCTANAV